jgi:hypothetical protein
VRTWRSGWRCWSPSCAVERCACRPPAHPPRAHAGRSADAGALHRREAVEASGGLDRPGLRDAAQRARGTALTLSRACADVARRAQIKVCVCEFNRVDKTSRVKRALRASEFKERFEAFNTTVHTLVPGRVRLRHGAAPGSVCRQRATAAARALCCVQPGSAAAGGRACPRRGKEVSSLTAARADGFLSMTRRRARRAAEGALRRILWACTAQAGSGCL